MIAGDILLHKFQKGYEEIRYIDLGANHYKRGNNTYLMYKKGAKGVLVEADINLCHKLKKRSRDTVINAAVSNEKKEKYLDFYIMSLPTRSTLSHNQAENMARAGLKITDIVKVGCMTVEEIIESTKIVPDYLSVDIEGMDFQVLQSIDFIKYPIKVIVAEKSNEKNLEGQTMDSYMESKGYSVSIKTENNIIYTLCIGAR